MALNSTTWTVNSQRFSNALNAGAEDSQSSNPGSIPGSATITLSHATDFCRPHTPIEHNQQNVSQGLPAVVRRLRRVLAGWRARAISGTANSLASIQGSNRISQPALPRVEPWGAV